jgi:hypothetical protein
MKNMWLFDQFKICGAVYIFMYKLLCTNVIIAACVDWSLQVVLSNPTKDNRVVVVLNSDAVSQIMIIRNLFFLSCQNTGKNYQILAQML